MSIDEQAPAQNSADPAAVDPAAVDLADVQGNILRGYNLPDVRHFALSITDQAGAKAFLAIVQAGQDPIPAITSAAEWEQKPTACMNIAVTAPGLTQLGVQENTINAFSEAFVAGSAKRSVDLANDKDSLAYGVGLGDIKEAAPENWALGGPANPEIHIVLSLWTDEESDPCRDRISEALQQLFDSNGIKQRSHYDGHTFENGTIHFGYRDGISQPQIAGRPGDREADRQPDAPTGDFLLGKGYVNTYGGNFQESLPGEIADNGSYVVLRILEQDVDAFEQFIRRTGEQWDMHPELVAAKLVGRWRDGPSLVMKPHRKLHDDNEGDHADKLPWDQAYDRDHPIREDQLNDFDYAPTPEHPTNFNDDEGTRCPFGAHMRRMNPRGGAMGGMQHNHRIVRRGVPYGPEHDPKNPNDGHERGLLGVFICGDIATQFEFLQMTWANVDVGTPGVIGSRDPIIGFQPKAGGKFKLPTGDHRGTPMLTDVPRLVTTRGSLYGFMPGLAALRHLAGS
jgi:Dyp-type peroxidase family